LEVLFLGHVWRHYRAALRNRLGDRHALAFFATGSEPGVAEAVRTARVIVANGLPAALGRTADAVRLFMPPHSSGMTEATFDRRIDDIVDNIERLERGEPVGHIVAVGERRHT
jgi:hypothetical protein